MQYIQSTSPLFFIFFRIRLAGNELKVRSQVKQCSLCNEVWYCGNECQASDWSKGHKNDCSRKK